MKKLCLQRVRTILFLFVLCSFISLCLSSCKKVEKIGKHFRSAGIGLDRIVTLYSANGDTIQQWEGKFMIETINGIASWIGKDDKEVKISGTFVIEEK